jgi:hypothetical protein
MHGKCVSTGRMVKTCTLSNVTFSNVAHNHCASLSILTLEPIYLELTSLAGALSVDKYRVWIEPNSAIWPSCTATSLNSPFRSYVGPRPTWWFSCSRRFSWSLTLSNPIFLPHVYSPALIYFGRKEVGWLAQAVLFLFLFFSFKTVG